METANQAELKEGCVLEGLVSDLPPAPEGLAWINITRIHDTLPRWGLIADQCTLAAA